jgi:hypothetical protein
MPKGDLKDEYLDASANQRQFMTMRFAQLTVFLAISGFLVNIIFSESFVLPKYGDVVLKLGGLIVALLFWVHQERTMAYWNHFVQRAAELEKELGFNQYRSRPSAGLISSFKAMQAFYAIIVLFWISTFFWISAAS